ncbi:sigma-54-dependent transcriptional regulator [Methylomonas methanica]|jgi:two-component system response regulator PilR (NtrC family)|uniref:Sigma-54-dependent Fis family transcriptional regulator n=1 Tax=Methylomonas methanica TaxID=421 RepID=A0A177MJW7_METMH|nr:sigma-54 dependent transcriptional regulator [Methylomonas methanica]OAI00543.1 sigma-54-dependent Fis family transcriptional regulator [Methylomonas methanica]OAI06096.1 sigma-54-dependent Fis family transcriptional regulator [Methylomonas methanica]
MNMPVTLVVDDEPDIRELLEITLNRMHIQTRCAANLAEAKQLLAGEVFDLCLTDMKLPDGDGLDLVDHIQLAGLQLPVAVITAHGSMDIAIKAMKKGAFDFLSKPVDLAVLRQLVSHALQASLTRVSDKERRTRDILLGESALMCAIRSKIDKVARNQAPVYISGESGSGKELVARLIHQQSPRGDKPFIAINCGAIPPELMESEFFGHKKGSFTGAVADKQGLFQAADGGTLFLDEVADLPLPLQVKLLRAIQEKKVRPVGEQREVAVDVRLLSATHKDLAKMVQEGSFRQDLYYRINVIELSLPPLRARPADIPQLTEHLLAGLATANGMALPKLTDSALNALKHYYFPGNVRELENILERALALHDGGVIEADDLNLPLGMELAAVEDFDAEKMSLETYLEDIEKKALSAALEENRWNKTATAKYLGLSFRSLRYRLKKLGLE